MGPRVVVQANLCTGAGDNNACAVNTYFCCWLNKHVNKGEMDESILTSQHVLRALNQPFVRKC